MTDTDKLTWFLDNTEWGHSLCHKYDTRVEVKDNDKPTILRDCTG